MIHVKVRKASGYEDEARTIKGRLHKKLVHVVAKRTTLTSPSDSLSIQDSSQSINQSIVSTLAKGTDAKTTYSVYVNEQDIASATPEGGRNTVNQDIAFPTLTADRL